MCAMITDPFIDPAWLQPDSKGYFSTSTRSSQEIQRRIQEEWLNPPPREANISTDYFTLRNVCNELGEETFKEMAPQLYSMYKEMKHIAKFRKASELLEG